MNRKMFEAATHFVHEGRFPQPWGDQDGRMVATDGASMFVSPPNEVTPGAAINDEGRYITPYFDLVDVGRYLAHDANGPVPPWLRRIYGWDVDAGAVLVRIPDGRMQPLPASVGDNETPEVDLHYLCRVALACEIMGTLVVAVTANGIGGPVVFRAENGCRFFVMPVRPANLMKHCPDPHALDRAHEASGVVTGAPFDEPTNGVKGVE